MSKRRIGIALAVSLAALWLGLAALTAAPASPAASAVELHVCKSGCTYSSVQAAINAAAPNDVIKVASGIYTDVHEFYIWSSPANSARQVAYITKSLTLAGGYTVTDWTTPDPVANPTVLDAEGEGRVVQVWEDGANTPLTATLRGLQIRGGDTSAGGAYNAIYGGGIYARAAHLILEDCRVESNRSTGTSGGGGGIYAFQSTVAMTDTVLTHNQADRDGGGLYLHDTPLTLIGSEIISNSAQNHAGGVYAYNFPSTVYAVNTRFHDNRAKFGGGGLSLNGPDGTLIDTVFTANRANGGAALASNLGTLEVTGGTFSGNEATGSGGALSVENADGLTITKSLLQENRAGQEGGALRVRNSDVFLENVAVVDNTSATEGSGLWLSSVDATLNHVTLARNTGGDGTGLHITHAGTRYSNVEVANTIIAGHTLGVSLEEVGDAASLNTVLWDGNTTNRAGSIAVSNNRSGDAHFGPDGYHLMPGSDAFEQGNPNYTPQATDDIDGDPRPMKSGYDIGADELPFETEMYRNPAFVDLHPGEDVEFWFKIINRAPSTYTVAYTYTVPACLIPQGAITGTGVISPGYYSWFSPRTTFAVAPDANGPCTNTATFVTAEGLQGSASLAVNVVESEPVCAPISTLDLSASPDGDLTTGATVRFLADAQGGSRPVTYTWSLDGIPLNATGAVYERTFADAGTYTLGVTATNGCSTETAATTLTLADDDPDQPDLSASQLWVSQGTAASGDVLTYTLILRNGSAVTATATVTNTRPNHSYASVNAGSEYASDGGTQVYEEDFWTWSGEVVSGTPVVLRYAVTVNNQAPEGTVLEDVARVDNGAGRLIQLDAETVIAPGFGLLIDGGASYTAIPTVALTYGWDAASAVSEVRLGSCSGSVCVESGWLPLPTDANPATHAPWTLDVSGDDPLLHTAWVLYRDDAGAVTGPFYDTILYDPAPPSITGIEVISGTGGMQMRAASEAVTVRVTTRDANAGVDVLHASNTADFSAYTEVPVTGPTTIFPWTLAQGEAVHVRAVDRAGNVSTPLAKSYEPDHKVFLPLVIRQGP